MTGGTVSHARLKGREQHYRAEEAKYADKSGHMHAKLHFFYFYLQMVRTCSPRHLLEKENAFALFISAPFLIYSVTCSFIFPNQILNIIELPE